MTIKTFFVVLLVGFITYEVFSITIGVIKKKRDQKKNNNESEDKN